MAATTLEVALSRLEESSEVDVLPAEIVETAAPPLKIRILWQVSYQGVDDAGVARLAEALTCAAQSESGGRPCESGPGRFPVQEQ